MFQCISCTKRMAEEREEEACESGTPRRKEAVKSLSGQLKGMALKLSGTYKQYKPSTGSSSTAYKKGLTDIETGSEGVQYPYMGGISSSSTPLWEFPSSQHHPGGRYPTLTAGFGGDQTPRAPVSAPACEIVAENEGESQEWVAEVEPGVHLTFVSLPDGGNDLKRIRFSREMFAKWEAQRWWVENYDRIKELYNVQKFTRQDLNTPPQTEEEQSDSSYPTLASARGSPMSTSFKDWTRGGNDNEASGSGSKGYDPFGASGQGGGQNFHAGSSSMEASKTTTASASRDEAAVSHVIEIVAEWIEQDQPGVFITVRQFANGRKELRRVRFSRQKFREEDAKNWWDENRDRVEAQYL